MGGASGIYGGEQKCVQGFGGETQWREGKSRHRWEDNIKMYLKEIGWEGMDWIFLAQDRVMSGLL